MTERSENETRRNIASRFAPQTEVDTAPTKQVGISALSQLGLAYIGSDALTVACLIETLRDASGNFSGERFYPVASDIQQHRRIKPHVRNIELRSARTASGEARLVPRKLPKTGMSLNSWSESAETCIAAATERWGTIISDQAERRYDFHPGVRPPQMADEAPEVSELFEKYLSGEAIESLEHRYIRKQFGSLGTQQRSALDQAVADMGDDPDVF